MSKIGNFSFAAVAMLLGTSTSPTTATWFIMTWFALTGFGLGLAMPTMLNAALGALTAERSGSGSALMSAMRQVGATIGVAVLGTVIANVYQSRLHLPGLPASVADAARSSVAAGVAVAHSAPAAVSGGLLDAVHLAYTDGLDVMLWICAGIAIVSAILAALFIPRNATDPAPVTTAEAGGAAAAGNDAEPAGVAGAFGDSAPAE